MTSLTLPTELLIKIFSIVSSPSDLYHSLLCSKRLATVIRPFLYYHIIIETKLQRGRLESIRDVDKKLVRKVTIKGDGPIEISKMKEHFESKEGCRLGGDCLVDLYNGKLLDISTIEILHVINVHEDPRLPYNITEVKDGFTVHKTASSLKPKLASSLIELQISHHQGGAYHWMNLSPSTQSPPNHPACKRLAYTNVSLYKLPSSNSLSTPPGPEPMSLGLYESDVPVGFIRQLEFEISTTTLYSSPLFGGRAAHLAHFTTNQLDESLVDGNFWHEILRRPQIWIDGDASTLHRLLCVIPQPNLPSLADFRPRFLLLPSGGRNIFECFDIDCSKLEIHYYTPEEQDSFLLIPPQFVDYVGRMKRSEPEETKAALVWGV